MKMKKCIPGTMLLLNLVNYFKFFFREAFTHLGLLKPPAAAAEEEGFYSPFNGIILLTDSRSGSLVPVPTQLVTAMIKKKVPVVEYGNFMERIGDELDEEQLANCRVCTVCLESMEENDKMRELYPRCIQII
ncbi:hypothetical protein CCACVL1_13314 [Corchorus capsularis]|uniref:Uncharacterized protein n=1 Tax=Corchorus capsularis TaxID=210143 RepID=A0A1R3IBI5_COCAP|nr:hypothetical protein CCACVL1_13314 [Corchorus capsularis]